MNSTIIVSKYFLHYVLINIIISKQFQNTLSVVPSISIGGSGSGERPIPHRQTFPRFQALFWKFRQNCMLPPRFDTSPTKNPGSASDIEQLTSKAVKSTRIIMGKISSFHLVWKLALLLEYYVGFTKAWLKLFE